ncbi:Bardet-Biedl syndrome 10 protein homolog isoform X1 [Anabrus simplex]|uniref:Bardet-Biedl syndrome 10 protein homolog isoform X1 n=1 Tax=Anabrus simplex TaxID=316456 RepID=UPI0035A3CDFE
MERQKGVAGCSREFSLESAVQEAEELGTLLSCSFGPGGRAALVQQPTGQLTVTRCGWAVLKAVYEDIQEPPNPIRRILLECAGKIENCLGDGVKCFIFMLSALLKHVQQLKGSRSRLITEFSRLQMSVAQLTFLEYGTAAVADHCCKITSTFFHTRFPVSVSLSLEQVFHKWLSRYLTRDCDVISTLHHLYKNFAVLCVHQQLGSRSVCDCHVVAGFLVSRPAFNLCNPGPHVINVLLFGDDSDGALDVIDVECEVNSFLNEVSDDVPTLLLTSHILSDLMLFSLRRKKVVVLHGVPQAEAEYVSSLLQRNVPIEVKSAIEGTLECTWLGLLEVNHLVLCGPTETLSREYASSCLGAIRLLLMTAKHRTLVKAGGWFERTLNFKLISKLEPIYQRQSVFSVTSRAELLIRHQQYRNLKEEGDNIEKLSSEISLLSCCDSEKELVSVAQALLCTDRDVVLAIAGSLLAVPHKLDKSPWCGHRQAFESLAFKAQIIQHVISAAVQILRIGSMVNISKASKTFPNQ